MERKVTTCVKCGCENIDEFCLTCARTREPERPTINCACGHNIYWHFIEIFPHLLTETNCRYPGCTCGGFHIRNQFAIPCSCTGAYSDGSPRSCCTGGVVGCTCDVDWDEI